MSGLQVLRRTLGADLQVAGAAAVHKTPGRRRRKRLADGRVGNQVCQAVVEVSAHAAASQLSVSSDNCARSARPTQQLLTGSRYNAMLARAASSMPRGRTALGSCIHLLTLLSAPIIHAAIADRQLLWRCDGTRRHRGGRSRRGRALRAGALRSRRGEGGCGGRW